MEDAAFFFHIHYIQFGAITESAEITIRGKMRFRDQVCINSQFFIREKSVASGNGIHTLYAFSAGNKKDIVAKAVSDSIAVIFGLKDLITVGIIVVVAGTVSGDCQYIVITGRGNACGDQARGGLRQCFLIGCGLGQTEETAALTKFLLDTSTCPVILDADGLNIASHHIEWIPKGRTVLTPHPAEAARLLGITADEVQADRPGAARRLAKKTGAVVVLKGAGSIVTDERFMAVCNAGNPGMAKAGSGDVLAGILGALAAQRMSLFDAAYTAVMLHAAAADAAAAEMPRGYMLPQDTIAYLQEVE
jgi:NAD(P)H-hydrate repair Nnr-like enzyme with NAD(P)H-hydrate dehydratase domain